MHYLLPTYGIDVGPTLNEKPKPKGRRGKHSKKKKEKEKKKKKKKKKKRKRKVKERKEIAILSDLSYIGMTTDLLKHEAQVKNVVYLLLTWGIIHHWRQVVDQCSSGAI